MFQKTVELGTNRWLHYAGPAECLQAQGRYVEAADILERWVKIFPDRAIPRWYQARNLSYMKKYDLALETLDEAFGLDPTLDRTLWLRGDIFLCRGSVEKAENEYKKMVGAERPSIQKYGWERLGLLYVLQGKLKRARQAFEKGADLSKQRSEETWQSRFHSNLAYVRLRSGNLPGALEEIERAQKTALESENAISNQAIALCLKGMILLQGGSMEEAGRSAKEIEALLRGTPFERKMRYFYQLRGRIKAASGDFDAAIADLKNSCSMIPSEHDDVMTLPRNEQALYFDSLADAYQKAGDPESSIREYEKITSLTIGRQYYGDIFVMAYYRLGKNLERKGWKGKAIENYCQFINRWQDCDPEFRRLVDDARARVRELGGGI
jgi:tetratricopeptide (TPR) repeat protein